LPFEPDGAVGGEKTTRKAKRKNEAILLQSVGRSRPAGRFVSATRSSRFTKRSQFGAWRLFEKTKPFASGHRSVS